MKIPETSDAPGTNGRDGGRVVVGISDALADVEVAGEEYERQAKVRDDLAAELSVTNIRIVNATATAARLVDERAALSGLRDRAEARSTKLSARLGEISGALRTAAVQRYVSGAGEDLYPDPNETIEEQLLRARSDAISSRGLDRALAARVAFETTIEELTLTVAGLDDALRDNERDVRDNQSTLTESTEQAARLTNEVIAAEADVRLARANALLAGTDLPMLALDAYWRAAERMAVAKPSCGLEWWGLAGTGRSESNHGRFAGGELELGGSTTVPIYGIPLLGTNGTRAVADSDGGSLDGDATVDRAVGPMQFIPSTWRRYAADGSGDGTADPQNLYDAALAAASYLCAYGPGLDGPDGLRPAYFGYNRSDAYVDLVLQRSLDYLDAGTAAGVPSTPKGVRRTPGATATTAPR